MPRLLQPRLSCFYCGSRSPHLKDGATRQFNCHVCEATNHLDHKGEITDPPATPAQPQTQSFAHGQARKTSPSNNLGGDSLFCKTCLKNQHFLTTCLAEYLPSEDDPDYEKYERQYPQYRKDLERRYPQVCPQCAPRAQERIQKTGYAAKVDFLTRSLERSRAHPVTSIPLTVKAARLALTLATIAWWVSLLPQALWHTFGLSAIPQDPEEVANMKLLMLIGCSMTALNARFLPPGCSHLLANMVRQSLRLTLLLAWWNPALTKKMRSPGRNYQWTGLVDFYRFQLLIYLVRLVSWWTLADSSNISLSADMIRGLHGLGLFFMVLGALASQRMVDYIPAPKFTFKDTSAPLLDPDGFQYPADPHESLSISRPSVTSARASPPKPFNIASLGSRPAFPEQSQRLPPSASFMGSPSSLQQPDPVLQDQPDSVDSMDWEPVTRHESPILRRTHNLTTSTAFPQMSSPTPIIPAFLRAPATASTGEKSPFTGRLPPAPISPAHRLRNPPPRPQFKPTPLSKQQNFFQQMGLSKTTAEKTHRRSLSGDESEEAPADANGHTYLSTDREKDPFRPAQWTLRSDLDAATRGTGTGLEDMFSTSFKLGDDTPTQTPRRNRRREVGGDGREVFERAQAQTAAAANMLGSNIQTLFWPIMLALLGMTVALAREPSGRQWVCDRWDGFFLAISQYIGAAGQTRDYRGRPEFIIEEAI